MSFVEVIAPLVGGALIGLAASLMLLFSGRVAGVSSILGGLFEPARGDVSWRLLFVLGLLAGGLLVGVLLPGRVAFTLERPAWALIAAGLLVGFGSRLGSGCTSGHGVCGISRLSLRSVAATMTFMIAGALTVYVTTHLVGGGA